MEDTIFTQEIPIDKGWVVVEYLRSDRTINLYYTLYDLYTQSSLILTLNNITLLNVNGKNSFSVDYAPSTGKMYIYVYNDRGSRITIRKFSKSASKHYYGVAIYFENGAITTL